MRKLICWRVTRQKRAWRGISYTMVLDMLNSADLQTGELVQLGGQRTGGLLPLLRKCMLDWGKRCKGKIWVPRAHVSWACQTLFWLFQLWNKHEFLLFFMPEGKKKSLSPVVMLRPHFCNRTWLQQMQNHLFTELHTWTQTEDDSLWLCSFRTNYTAFRWCHCTGCLWPGTVCHDYNVQQGSEYIKVSGRWGCQVLVCQLLHWKANWAQLTYYTIHFSFFAFVLVMYILKLIRGKFKLYTSNNVLCSKLNPKWLAKITENPTDDCFRWGGQVKNLDTESKQSKNLTCAGHYHRCYRRTASSTCIACRTAKRHKPHNLSPR